MIEKSLKIIFMGTPDFAAAALQAILDSRHQVICIYTQPPRPKGRGQMMQNSPVHQLAEAAGIPVRHPQSLKRDEQARADFIALGADIAVVAAYGLILPADVLDAPLHGCVNIHASLLPRWRGASPIQRAIWAGDRETGITLMKMDAGLDTGDIIKKGAVEIGPKTTTPELHDALALLGGAMIVPFLDRLSVWPQIDGEKQDDGISCYAPLLTKDDGRVDWSQDAAAIDRQIRALNPWPGVWTHNESGKRMKIHEAVLIADDGSGHAQAPGTILDKTGAVACGAGTKIQLIKIQPENGKAMDAAAAVNGGYLTVDTRLN